MALLRPSSCVTLSCSTLKTLLLLLISSAFMVTATAAGFVARISYSGSVLSPLFIASNISIGTPAQPQRLLISTDSASYILVRCTHDAGFFNPRLSSSFVYLKRGDLVTPRPRRSDRLAMDTFLLRSSRGRWIAIPKVTFACTSSILGLGYSGIASLTPTKQGLPAQLRVRKFAYCLPSSSTDQPTPLLLGNVPYTFLMSPVSFDISQYLARAKLYVNHNSGSFSVNLKNITIEGEPLGLKSPLKLRISSMDPFTKIPGGIYRRMRSIFLKKAAARGMKIVQSHPPFDTCFNSSSIGFSRVGPAAPPMELELTGVGGKDVGWSVFGFNSIVSVSDEKSCWAFLDGGAQTHSTSVLGTFQQQGNFFEFDLQNSTLGFSGHLNFFRTSCSNFAF